MVLRLTTSYSSSYTSVATSLRSGLRGLYLPEKQKLNHDDYPLNPLETSTSICTRRSNARFCNNYIIMTDQKSKQALEEISGEDVLYGKQGKGE